MQIAAFQRLHQTVEQIPLATHHILHGGMYARTIHLAGGIVLCGAIIKLPTMLVIDGSAEVFDGEGWLQIAGRTVLCGSAGRQQVFVTTSPLALTMIFPTQAKTVEQAEAEFTDECEKLMSRHSDSDTILVTGE